MGKKRQNHASKWSSKGGGMKKHARSGHSHNHRITREMNREEARRMEEESKRREARKKKGMTDKVRDLFEGL